jgi:hypothetical protein
MDHPTNINNILYKSGDLFLPKNIVRFLDRGFYDSQERFYINFWTALHFLSGIIIGKTVSMYTTHNWLYYGICFTIHTLWELWQVYIGMAKPWKLSGSSNLIDSFIDTAAFMFGTFIVLYQKNI